MLPCERLGRESRGVALAYPGGRAFPHPGPGPGCYRRAGAAGLERLHPGAYALSVKRRRAPGPDSPGKQPGDPPVRRPLLLALTLAFAAPAAAQPKAGPDPKDLQAAVEKAYEFLKAHQKP